MTTRTHEWQPTLVLGGTGKTGRRVAERLKARGQPVRVGSRSGEPPFDWEDRSTWDPVLDGVASAYISYYPDIAIPGAAETVGSFAELAVRSGIEEFEAAAAEQGVPSEVIELLAYLFGEVLDGRNARLADGVQRALGREPRDFSDYARDATATGVWTG